MLYRLIVFDKVRRIDLSYDIIQINTNKTLHGVRHAHRRFK